MLDMTAMLTEHLRGSADLMSATSDAVYADITPEGVTYPWVLVRTLEVVDAVPPVTLWEKHELQIDVVGSPTAFGELVEAVSLVRDRLATFTGDQGTAAVAGTDVVAITRTTDESVSPARPRWVLAVEVTARGI